jgi:hypothetical protein
MNTTKKLIPEHKDILGQDLSIGNYVAVPYRNDLHVCIIIKLTPKQIRIRPLKHKTTSGWLKYPEETVLLSGPDAMVYILKHSGS